MSKNLQRILACLTSLILGGISANLASYPMPIATAADSSTSDVTNLPKDMDQSSPYAIPAIEKLSARNIITGDENGNFHPQDSITRAELITMMIRSLNITTSNVSDTATFRDVPQTNWAYKYVETALEKGIVTGVSPDQFAPDQPCTREQLATLYTRALGLSAQDINGLSSFKTNQQQQSLLDRFTDQNNISGYAKDPTAFAVYQNIMKGTSESTFDPQGEAKREQVAVVTDRFLENKNNLEATTDAFHAASSAKISADQNGVYLSFTQPVQNLQVWFTDPNVKSELSRPNNDFSTPLGYDDPYVSPDRTFWEHAFSLKPGKTYTINYRVRFFSGDYADHQETVTVPADGLNVSQVQVLDSHAVKVLFNHPIHPNVDYKSAFKATLDDNDDPITKAVADQQSIVLNLQNSLTSGSKLKVTVSGRTIESNIQNSEEANLYDPDLKNALSHTCPMECGPYFANRFPAYSVILSVQDINAVPPVTSILPDPSATDSIKPYYHVNGTESTPVPDAELKQMWERPVNGHTWLDVTPISMAGNKVITVDGGFPSEVMAYDAITGEQVWHYEMDHSSAKTMTYGTPTHVFVVPDDESKQVTVFSAEDGKMLWNTTMDAPVKAIDVRQGKAFILTTGNLSVYDAASGSPLWSATLNGTALALNDAQVWIGTATGEIKSWALDGTPRFSTQLAAIPVKGLALSNDSLLVTQDNNLTSLNFSGEKVWADVFDDSIVGGNIAISNNFIYALFTKRIETPIDGDAYNLMVNFDGIMKSIDLKTGQIILSKEIPDTIVPGNSPVAQGDKVYFTSQQRGRLLIVNGTTLDTENIITQYHFSNGVKSPLNWSKPVLYNDQLIGLSYYPGESEVLALKP